MKQLLGCLAFFFRGPILDIFIFYGVLAPLIMPLSAFISSFVLQQSLQLLLMPLSALVSLFVLQQSLQLLLMPLSALFSFFLLQQSLQLFSFSQEHGPLHLQFFFSFSQPFQLLLSQSFRSHLLKCPLLDLGRVQHRCLSPQLFISPQLLIVEQRLWFWLVGWSERGRAGLGSPRPLGAGLRCS